MDKLTAARHEAELGFLQELLRELGYDRVQLYERSEQVPYPTLAVGLDADAAGRDRSMALTFYPTDELEDTLLLQYYLQLPFRLDPEGLQRVAGFLPYLNRRLVLGHFGISEEEGAVHYRYVQALPADEMITRERMADVVALVTVSPLLFEAIVEKLGTGVISVDDARAQADARYEGQAT